MNFDVSLAGWVLSIISFILGTITPALYRRLFHEGFAIRQFMQMTVLTPTFTSNKKGKQGYGVVVFSTLLKIANVQKESILINDIKVRPFKVDSITFEQFEGALGSEFQFVGPGEAVTLPPSMAEEVESTTEEVKSKTGVDGPPFIIKTDEEKVMAVGIRFTYTPNISEDIAIRAMTKHISKGLRVSFQVNGKYRSFMLRIQQRLPNELP
jgi:hypothetical protein